jgi:hypothetical protein
MIVEKAGSVMGACATAFSNRIPFLARLSIWGVLIVSYP